MTVTDNAKTSSKSAKAKAAPSDVEEPQVEAPAVTEAAEPAPAEPAFSGEEWVKAAKRQLGVPPWILQGALAGRPEGQLFTRGEIDKLIRAALNEPA